MCIRDRLWRGLEPGRVARRAAGVGALALIALTYWNHEAWIVRESVARYVQTGHLDTLYLLDLSPNAVPAIVESLSILPEGPAGLLRESLQRHYSPCLLYTSDAADERSSVDLGGRR